MRNKPTSLRLLEPPSYRSFPILGTGANCRPASISSES